MEEWVILAALGVAAIALAVARRQAGPARLREVEARLAAELEASRAIQARLDQTAAGVSELAGRLEERRRLEEQAVEAVARVESLVAGSFSRGRAGENLLEAAFAEFPPEMVVRDFVLGGRVCEFALRLAGGKLLPIDSKWVAGDLVAGLDGADSSAREEARRRAERAVCRRLEEVAGYLDPGLTAPLAVVALPDALYACCRKAHAVAAARRLVVISYSLAVPFLMSVWLLDQTHAGRTDSEHVLARVHDVAVCLRDLSERIEGRMSRALTTAGNALLDMRAIVARAEASIGAIRRSTEGEVSVDGSGG